MGWVNHRLALGGLLVGYLIFSLIACSPATSTSQPARPSASVTSSELATPTPTPPSKETILYSANWSHGLTGWQASPGWRVVGGQLVVDSIASTSILAPYRPSTANYAVEARIQVVRVLRSNANSYYIFAADAPGKDGYQAGAIGLTPPPWGPEGVYAGFTQGSPDKLDVGQGYNSSDFVPGTGWRTYRAEVRGNQLTYLVDGDRVDTTYTAEPTLSTGPLGLQSMGLELRVSSFSIFAL